MSDEATPHVSHAEGDALSGEEVRRATFPQALRGYDRQAVHDLLDRVADWVEGQAGAVTGATPGMREELAKVGERTAGILTAAEEAARNLREEAAEYAERLRSNAEDEARKERLNASQRMDEMVAEAETKAQRIIDDAVARRRQLNQAISSLVERRNEIAADAAHLAEELKRAVEGLRGHGSEDLELEQDLEPEAEELETDSDELEPASEEFEPISEENALPEADPDATVVFEVESEEADDEPEADEAEADADDEHDEPEPDVGRRQPPTLLVDPDAEDETPPRHNS